MEAGGDSRPRSEAPVALGGKQASPASHGYHGDRALCTCVSSPRLPSRPSSKVASWIRRVASFPEAAAQVPRISPLPGGHRGLGAAINHVPTHPSGPELRRAWCPLKADHLPAGHVDQRTAEGMLAVPDQAGLELEEGWWAHGQPHAFRGPHLPARAQASSLPPPGHRFPAANLSISPPQG